MSNLTATISIQQIAKRAKNNAIQHIKSSTLSDQLKELILNDVEEEKNIFYFCYASLFTDKESEWIDNINLAGFFYYKYLIATDELVDNNNSSKNTFRQLILTNFYHEESIRLLTIAFNHHPEFWNYFGLRKAEYLSAFQTDKKYLNTLSEFEFELLADNKSANGKVAIDSLFVMGTINQNDYQSLLLSHKLFSCGFQYYDDVLDLKQDILNKQTNIALCELKQKMSEEDFLNGLENPDKMHKLMHIKGLASSLLKKSIASFEEAKNVITAIDCPFWKQVIDIKKKEVQGILQNVDFYLEALKIKTQLSNKKIELKNDFAINLMNAITSSINYIAVEQEKNGSWKDSPVNTWLSGYWTTGYVLNAISFFKNELTEKINVTKAIEYLNKKNTLVWPYIEAWVEDADSTNFALLGLIANNQNIAAEITELLNYQKEDGGFTTYNNTPVLLESLNDPNIKDVSGWTQSHVCVSAGTLLVLSKIKGFDSEKNKLINYLLQNISENKLWNSYWWTSEIYSTSLIIEASAALNNEALNVAVQQAITPLLSLQKANHLFADEFNEAHIFYSALVLNALCTSKTIFIQHQNKIHQLANAIINMQNEDGSWDSSYALRVPASTCLNPNEIPQWKKHDLGQNVIIEDIHRIITTATVAAALARYKNRAAENE